MSASCKGVEEAFAFLDDEKLSESFYPCDSGRKFRADSSKFLSFLNVLRKEGESGFCDVVLEVDGQSFPAHRCVLAANSEFFYTLFTSGMRDSNDKHVKLSCLSSSAVSTILDFFYTREIVINEDNIEDLLEAASFLLLNHVKNACGKVLSRSLSASNCFSTKRLADRYALDELKTKADSITKDNFEEAMHQREFLELEPSELKELVCSDSLKVEKEEEVFEAIVIWVKHDPTNRSKELSNLLPCLRYGSLSLEFLEVQFENDALFENNSFCENLLKQQRRRNRSTRSKEQPIAKERPSAKIHDVLIGVGKFNIRTSFCFDVQSDQFYALPEPPTRSYNFGLAAVGQELYTLNNDIAARGWQRNATSLQMCDLGYGNIDYAEPSWDEIDDSLLQPNACGFKSIILSLKDKLYVLGGCMKFENRSVDVQCYDPAEGEWEAMANMCTSRCRIGAVATSNYIYAIGGTQNHDTATSTGVNTVERYNPETNEWIPMADMVCQRIDPKAVATSDSIFAIGGYSTSVPQYCHCEVYHEVSDKWSIIAGLWLFPTVLLSLNDEVFAIGEGQSWTYSKKNGFWIKSQVFKSLQGDCLESVHLIQHKLPKFFCEKYDETTMDDIFPSRDENDDEEEEEDEEDGDEGPDYGDFLRYMMMFNLFCNRNSENE